MPTALTDADKVLRNDTGKDIVSELQNLVAAVKPDAEDIPYDNTTSGLTADDVQGAIDEIKGNVDTLDDNKSEKSDLTDIITTGTSNTTGSTIASGTFFYLNRTLVRAIDDIQNGSDYDSSNYEEVTAGGLNSVLKGVDISDKFTVETGMNITSALKFGNIVIVTGTTSKVTTANTYVSIATADQGYRPTRSIPYLGSFQNATSSDLGYGSVSITQSGAIQFIYSRTTSYGLYFSLVYVI